MRSTSSISPARNGGQVPAHLSANFQGRRRRPRCWRRARRPSPAESSQPFLPRGRTRWRRTTAWSLRGLDQVHAERAAESRSEVMSTMRAGDRGTNAGAARRSDAVARLLAVPRARPAGACRLHGDLGPAQLGRDHLHRLRDSAASDGADPAPDVAQRGRRTRPSLLRELRLVLLDGPLQVLFRSRRSLELGPRSCIISAVLFEKS
jgi:hypothetical protein